MPFAWQWPEGWRRAVVFLRLPWRGHGGPTATAPTEPCGGAEAEDSLQYVPYVHTNV